MNELNRAFDVCRLCSQRPRNRYSFSFYQSVLRPLSESKFLGIPSLQSARVCVYSVKFVYSVKVCVNPWCLLQLVAHTVMCARAFKNTRIRW